MRHFVVIKGSGNRVRQSATVTGPARPDPPVPLRRLGNLTLAPDELPPLPHAAQVDVDHTRGPDLPGKLLLLRRQAVEDHLRKGVDGLDAGHLPLAPVPAGEVVRLRQMLANVLLQLRV